MRFTIGLKCVILAIIEKVVNRNTTYEPSVEEQFLAIMFENWTTDELGYLPTTVMGSNFESE